jgi:N-acyl-D-aspartate/D-glutamate deacylase
VFNREAGYPFVPPRRRGGLIDRGALRPGFAADITIFDPASIADRATFHEPRRYPAGITHVIVNGVAVIDGGVSHHGASRARVATRGHGHRAAAVGGAATRPFDLSLWVRID